MHAPVAGAVGSVPIPDPTFLTTQALDREVNRLEDMMERDLLALKDVSNEKHLRAEQQFELVERQRVEQKKDTKDAVDAALTAQKEAVREQTAASEKAIEKSEKAINRLVEQLADTFRTEAAALRREISEVKDRTTQIESTTRGGKEATIERQATSASSGMWVGIGLSIIGVAIIIIGLIATLSATSTGG